MIEALWQDLRYGMRMLLRNPGFTVVAVLALALGIGANTAIYSVVQAVLLRPLPFPRPEQLVTIERASLLLNLDLRSPGEFLSWKQENQVFEQVAAYSQGNVNLSGSDEPERVLTMQVTASFFPTLGINPAVGRAFGREEEQAGRNRVVVLSDGLWQRRFGANPAILGQSLTLNGQRFTVIGIMPPDFLFPQFPGKAELWVPLTYQDDVLSAEVAGDFEIIARIKPGLTYGQAQALMDAAFRRLQQASPQLTERSKIKLVPLSALFVRDLRTALLMLLGAGGFVLLIACANVANLLLARAATRQKEVAIRSALGAGRGRLMRQWLTESLLLAGLGGALGLLLARWSTDALVAISPAYIPRAQDIHIDGRVLGFTLVVSLLTGILFGLAPALQFSKPDLRDALKDGAHSLTGSTGRRLTRHALVIAEVALSLVLLLGAGLLMKSFLRLQAINPGFNPSHTLSLNLWLPRTTYPEAPQRAAFYQQVLERIRAVPGVQAAGAVNNLPLAQMARFFTSFTVEGRAPSSSDRRGSGGSRVINPGYFRAMEIPLLQGRDFTERDDAQAPPVVIINEGLARFNFPGENPIGQRIKIGNRPACEIVGVVSNVSHFSLEQGAEQEFYLPHAQRPLAYMSVVVRTAADPRSMIGAVRNAVWAVDKTQPVYHIKTMEQVLGDSLSQRRFSMLLLGLFAAVALALAVVGVYGVMSYSVNQRTHEIGIRLALGAQASNVLKLVVRQGMMLILIGVSIGLAAAFGLTRVLTSLLHGVSATDPLTFASLALLLTLIALLACYLPARRATKVDPMVALRHE